MNWSWSFALWLAAYVALLGGVAGGMLKIRGEAIFLYGTAEAQAEWDAWRADAKKMEEQPGVVKRRAPKSAEPPALVLMRDHFGVCLGGALVLSSVLFGTFMMLVRGAFGRVDYVRHRAVGGPSPPYES